MPPSTNVADLVNDDVYAVDAVLQLVSKSAYWYVDERLTFATEDLETAAEAFETRIRPTVVGSIGDIWSPGVDNDPRLTILHTPLDAVAGYYGSQDEYPATVHPQSNEREMIYMDGGRLKPGTTAYLGVLAHEFQHTVHWNLDNGEEIWINEGMSEVIKELAGYRAELVGVYLRRTSTPFNYWSDEITVTPANYGASTLFLTYLHDHYGGPDVLGRLASETADGEASVDTVVAQQGGSFVSVFKDWSVANLVDAPDGKYGYPNRTVQVRDLDLVFAFGSREESLPQFGVQYLDLRTGEGGATIDFKGSQTVRIAATDCFGGHLCWWGNRGDSIDSTLTRIFDLTSVETATLNYKTWHLIENGWDYAYVEVSDDGGETWDILSPPGSTSSNPVGNSFGPAYTGSSGGWLDETVDLSEYAGRVIHLRFEYITDDAVYLDGLLLDDIAIPEIGFMDDGESKQRVGCGRFLSD